MGGFIPEDIISEICGANDIIDYVSQYTVLKRTGRDYTGLCPFHHEKSPSFHVNQEKQIFHCFGCGASGNLVQFVMRTQNLDFREAMQLLGDRAGIAISEEGVSDKGHEKKKRILEMNKTAARFFFSCLKDENLGKDAREYLFKRRISPKTITAYGLGFAPGNKNGLVEHLKKAGYSENELVEASLAVERDGRIIDKFRNRVMFPIIDLRGNVIGFGGRVMHNNKEVNGFKIPKYLNSGETAAFDKGKNLFSLNLAKNEKSTELILCEGYMDVISVYQAGVHNIVATLGTAITPQQAKLMLRYAKEIVICYDSDEAGIKAALRAIEIINGVGGKSRVIQLKGAKDPDEYINKNGAAAFRDAVGQALPSTQFRISLIKSKYDTDTPDGKVKFCAEVAEVLKSVPDAVEVDAYIKKVAGDIDISPEAIYSKYRQKKGFENGPKSSSIRRAVKKSGTERAEQINATAAQLEAEKRILALMTSSKKLYKIVSAQMIPNDFSKEVYRRIASAAYRSYEAGEQPEEAMILNEFSGNAQLENEASSVFYNMEIYNGDEATVRDLLNTVKLEKVKMQIDTEKDLAKLSALIAKREELLQEKNKWED
ncbi:MAG: DNA primase [Clostridiales bacterium]|nr:DNA primase [Clostridiales bacterium]